MVVNDLGGAVDGTGESLAPADEVVAEIRDAGSEAVANYDSVATMEGGENIVKTALDNFGKVDIVVTPAGILRDRMVFNMTEDEWDAVIAVHLKGTFTVCKFASILFRQQRSGCIITFSSTSGLFGNSGQSNYGARKGRHRRLHTRGRAGHGSLRREGQWDIAWSKLAHDRHRAGLGASDQGGLRDPDLVGAARAGPEARTGRHSAVRYVAGIR